jgi:hypothetical protein
VIAAVQVDQAVDAALLRGVGKVDAVRRGEVGQVEQQLKRLS